MSDISEYLSTFMNAVYGEEIRQGLHDVVQQMNEDVEDVEEMAGELAKKAVYYGTCSTEASTVAKAISFPNFSLVSGVHIFVQFSYTNTAENPTLNVNNNLRSIYYQGASVPANYIQAGNVYEFVYNGSYWNLVGELTEYRLNQLSIDGVKLDGIVPILHFASCNTGGATQTKGCTIKDSDGNILPFTLMKGARVEVWFQYTNTAAEPYLNISSSGAKPIRYKGAAVPSGYIQASNTYEFVYDGNYWRIIGDLADYRVEQLAEKVDILENTVVSGTKIEPTIFADDGSSYWYIDDPNGSAVIYSEAEVVGNIAAAISLTAGKIYKITMLAGAYNSFAMAIVQNHATWPETDFSMAIDAIIYDNSYEVQEYIIDRTGYSNSTQVLLLNYSTGTECIIYAYDSYEYLANKVTENQTAIAEQSAAMETLQTKVSEVAATAETAGTHYGTCSTAGDTAAKEVSIDNFTLVSGAQVLVRFTYTNTATSPTLNVNGTGAISIRYKGGSIYSYPEYIQQNGIYEFVYDGSYWYMVGNMGNYFSSYGMKMIRLWYGLSLEATVERAAYSNARLFMIEGVFSSDGIYADQDMALGHQVYWLQITSTNEYSASTLASFGSTYTDLITISPSGNYEIQFTSNSQLASDYHFYFTYIYEVFI